MTDDEIREWVREKRRADRREKASKDMLYALKALLAQEASLTAAGTNERVDQAFRMARQAVWLAEG